MQVHRTQSRALLCCHLFSLRVDKVHHSPRNQHLHFPKHYVQVSHFPIHRRSVTEQSAFILSARHTVQRWCQRATSSSTTQLLAATWPTTNTLSHQRSIWRQKHFCKMLSISSVTNLKSFLPLTVMFKCQNKSSVLSVTTDGYLGKTTPGLTAKGCSS